MLSILTENRCLIKLFQIGSILTSHCDLTMDGFFCLIMNKATRHSYCVLVIIGKIPYCGIFRNFLLNHWYKPVATMARIGYPKFGYPRVIPGPEPNFGYGLGWVCVWIPWVFSGWVPIKFIIFFFFGYYPWVLHVKILDWLIKIVFLSWNHIMIEQLSTIQQYIVYQYDTRKKEGNSNIDYSLINSR